MKDEKIKNDSIYFLDGIDKELIQRLYENLMKTKQELDLAKIKHDVCSQMLSQEIIKIKEAQKLPQDLNILDFNTWTLRREPLTK